MKKLLVIALIAFGAYQHFYADESVDEGKVAQAHDRVIMYSLTTCGYCKAKGRELHAQGIRFTEYFIDEDVQRRDELNNKLAEAGFAPRGYGTPIMDVHGVMMPNNPSVARIVEVMEKN